MSCGFGSLRHEILRRSKKRLEELDKKVTEREAEREWCAQIADQVASKLMNETQENPDAINAGVYLAQTIARLIRTLPRQSHPGAITTNETIQ